MDIVLQEMWPCLLLAMLIGTVLGWWMRRCQKREIISSATQERPQKPLAVKKNDDSKSEAVAFVDVLENQKSKLNDETIALKMQLSKAESEIKTSQLKLAALENEYTYKLQEKEKSFYDRDSVVRSLKENLQRREEELEGEKKRAEALEVELNQALKASQESSDKAQTQIGPLEDKLKKSELQLHYYEREIEGLQKSLKEKEDDLAKVDTHNEQSLKAQIADLEKKLEEQNVEKETLKKSLSRTQEVEDELKTLKTKLKEEQEISTQKLQVLQNDYEFKLNKALAEVKSSETQLAGIKEKLLRTQELVDTYKDENEKLQEELASGQNSKDTSKVEEQLVQAALTNIKNNKEIEQLQKKASKTDALVEELERLKKEIAKQDNTAHTVMPAMTKPQLLTDPKGKSDNLQLIKGIGSKLESVLNTLGIFHFWQIAAWNKDEVAWVNEHLAFSGRIEREEWIAQAKTLMEGNQTDFSKRVEAGEVDTSTLSKKSLKRKKDIKRLRKK